MIEVGGEGLGRVHGGIRVDCFYDLLVVDNFVILLLLFSSVVSFPLLSLSLVI